MITKLSEAYENDEDVSKIEIPDPKNPEAMKEPVPVMIDLSHCEKLFPVYGEGKTIVFGMITNAPHQTKTLNFLKFIME